MLTGYHRYGNFTGLFKRESYVLSVHWSNIFLDPKKHYVKSTWLQVNTFSFLNFEFLQRSHLENHAFPNVGVYFNSLAEVSLTAD